MNYEGYKAKRNAERQAASGGIGQVVRQGTMPKVESYDEYRTRRNAERVELGTANFQSSVNADYIDSYFEDTNKFLQGMVQDQQIGHWDYMTNPFTVEERNKKMLELSVKAMNVRQWFNQNREYMDDDVYSEYTSYLDALDSDLSSAREYYSSLKNYGSQEEYKAAVKRYGWQRQYMDADMLQQSEQLRQLQENGGSPAQIDDTTRRLQRSAANVDLSKVSGRLKELSRAITVAKGKGEDTTVMDREYEDLNQYYKWILNSRYSGQYAGMSYADLRSAIETQERFIASAQNLDESIWARNNTTLQQEQEKLAWLQLYAASRKTGQDYIRENEQAIADMEQMLTSYNMAQNAGWDAERVGQLNREFQEKYGVSADVNPIEWLKHQIWLMENENQYNFLSENADFTSKSQYNEATGQKDKLYRVINSPAENTRWQDTVYAKYINMEPSEIRTYNYVYATQGKAAAGEYLKTIEASLDARLQQEQQEYIEAEVDYNPAIGLLSAPVSWVMGVPTFLERAGKTLWREGKELVTGEYQPPVSMSSVGTIAGNLGENLSNATTKYLQEEYGNLHFNFDEEKNPKLAAIFNGHGLSDVYHLTNSGIQIGLQLATGKFIMGLGGSQQLASGLTAMMSSGSAASAAAADAVTRGGSDEQALMMGLSAGMFEWLFEKYEINELLSQTNKSVLSNTLKNALSEGVGEAATTLANTLADTIIMQDLSQFNATVQQYVNQGMSLEDAKKAAWIGLAANVSWDGLLGAISGGIAGGAKGVYTSVQSNVAAKKLFGKHVPVIVDQVLTQDPTNKLALDIKGKLDAGKTASGAQISKLVRDHRQIAVQVIRDASQTQQPVAAPVAAQNAAQTQQVPTVTISASADAQTAQAFTGPSGKTWNQQQAALLAAIPDSVLAETAQKLGKTRLNFDIVGLQDDPQAQQAWLDSGLAFVQLGERFVKIDALRDEIARRQSMPAQQSVAASQITSPSTDAQQILDWAKQSYESGGMSKEEYDGMVTAAQQYSSSGTNAPQTVPQQPVSGTNTPQTVTQQAIPGTNTPQIVTQQADPAMNPSEAVGQQQTPGATRKGTVRATDILVRPSREQWDMAQRIAEVTGRDIVLFRQEATKNGIHDGFEEDGVLYINVLSPNPMAVIFGHESCHGMEGTKEHDKLKKYVINRIERQGGSMEALRREKRDFYKKNGVDFAYGEKGRQKVDNEIVAAYVGRNLFNSEQAIRDVVEYDPSVGQRFLRWIDGILGAFGNKAAAERKFLHNAKLLYQKALSDLNSSTAQNKKPQSSATSTTDIVAQRQRLQQEYAAGQMDDETYTSAIEALDEEQLLQEGREAIPTKKKTAAQTSDNGEKHSYSYNNQTFLQQIQDFKDGIFPPYEAFFLGETPEVLRKIGLVPLPLTLNQSHMRAMLYGSYKGSAQEKLDHMFPESEVEKIPQKIADPIAIIWDKRKGKANPSESTIDVIVEMTAVSGKRVLVAIQVGGKGVVNSNTLDSNKVSTVHGNDDVLYRLSEAIDMHNNGMTSLFYINKDKTTNVFRSAGNPIPRGLNAIDGFIHSITDPGSPVKMRIVNQTQTRQFKNWFKGSKIVNADGTPKIMYHGSRARFTIFDKSKAKSSGLYGKGFYFTDSSSNAGLYGEQYSVYLNIRNPLQPDGSTVTRDQIRRFIEAIAENEDYSIENYGTYDVEEILNIVHFERFDSPQLNTLPKTTPPFWGGVVFWWSRRSTSSDH